MTPRDAHSPRPMIASSRRVYSPMSTVIFEVPISTAPMKVVLELTFGFRLSRREKVKFRRGGFGRLRVPAFGIGGRRLLDLQWHLAPEREIDPLRLRAGQPLQPLGDRVKPEQL